MREFIEYSGMGRLSQAQRDDIWVVANDIGMAAKRFVEELVERHHLVGDDTNPMEIERGETRMRLSTERVWMRLESHQYDARLCVAITPIFTQVGVRVSADIEPIDNRGVAVPAKPGEDPSGVVFLELLRTLRQNLGDVIASYR